jgi:hypothetical protein
MPDEPGEIDFLDETPDPGQPDLPPQPDPPHPTPAPETPPPPTEPVPAEEAAPLGPNDEIWDGGPTMGQIDAWKEQFGPDSIYVTSLTPSFHVVWRTLTRFEYRRLVKNMEQAVQAAGVSQAEANMNNEEQIVEICALYPQFNRQALSGELAGLPSIISQEVMEASAFVSLEVRQL